MKQFLFACNTLRPKVVLNGIMSNSLYISYELQNILYENDIKILSPSH